METRLKPRLRWLLAVMLVAGGMLAWADTELQLGVVFQRANERYRQGRFLEAAESYQTLLAGGMASGAVYYNLGNALVKAGRPSEALWAYLKARTWVPRDADVHANLAYVQSVLQAGAEASVRPSARIRWLTFHQRFATRELAWWAGLLSWAAALWWVLAAWWPAGYRLGRLAAGLTTLGAAAALLALVVQTVWVDRVPTALTLRDRVEVRFGPQASATTHYTLPEGTQVRVLGQAEGWVQVEREDGRAGWVAEDAVRAL